MKRIWHKEARQFVLVPDEFDDTGTPQSSVSLPLWSDAFKGQNPRRLWRFAKGKACPYCCVTMFGKKPRPTAPSMDHVVPRSRGGPGGDNLIWVCYGCNHDKNDRTLGEWLVELDQANDQRSAHVRNFMAHYGIDEIVGIEL